MGGFGWTVGEESKRNWCKELSEDSALGVAGRALIQPLPPKNSMSSTELVCWECLSRRTFPCFILLCSKMLHPEPTLWCWHPL